MLGDGRAIMQHSQLKISLAAFGIVVLFILINSKFDSNEKHSSMERAVERQPSSVVQNIPVVEKIIPNQNLVFHFDRRLKAVLDHKNVLTDIHYEGKMYVQWIYRQKNERTGLFTFDVNDSSIPAVFAEVKLDQGYQILSLKTPLYESENEQNAILFLKDLISIYAFQSLEDTSGKYEAEVKKSESTDETVWIKKKTRYENLNYASLKFTKSIHEIHLKSELEEASGLEETQKGELTTFGVYQLKRLNDNTVKSFSIQNLSMKPDSLTTNPNQVAKTKTSWVMLESKLNELFQLKGQEKMNAFHDVLTMLKNNPELLKEFMKWAKVEPVDPLKTRLAIGLLSSLGTNESQHELVTMYQEDKNQSREKSHLILNSFATSGSKLSTEAVGLLNAVLDQRKETPELAANAAYALGAAGDVKKITELAKKSSSTPEKVIYIDAIGNSGSLDSLPFLLESTKSSDPLIREKAIFALRFVNDPRVKTVFEQSINDPQVSVRYSVVKAVPYQAAPHEYDSMLKNCTNQSTEQNLRKLCSQTLANF